MAAPSRVACLWAHDLPLQALRRAEPELRGRPVIIVDVQRGRVLYASPEAAGVTPGMRSAQARAVCPAAALRPAPVGALRSARAALLDVALSMSPVVEDRGDALLLEVGDLGRLFPSEEAVAEALVQRAAAAGLRARVAVAGSGAQAEVLARSLRADAVLRVVPAGAEAEALAPLPLDALPARPEDLGLLQRWGLRTVGEVAALSRPAVARRLGAAGVQLHRLARGEDGAPLVPVAAPEQLREAVDFDDAIADAEGLGFVLRRLLERLVARLQVRGLSCAGYDLVLELDPRGQEELAVRAAAPTREVSALLSLGRFALAGRLPLPAVRGVAVVASAAPPRPVQLGLFAPRGPTPEQLGTTVARLAVLCGEDRAGTPADPAPAQAARYDVTELDQLAPLVAPPPAEIPAPEPAREELAQALRLYRPPRTVEVELRDGMPVSLRWGPRAGDGGRVVRAGGPYRLRVGLAAPSLRDCYDIELEGGALYQLSQDLASGAWLLVGRYD